MTDRLRLHGLSGLDDFSDGSLFAPTTFPAMEDPTEEGLFGGISAAPTGSPIACEVQAFRHVIAGGGPAGLTAGYELSRHGHSCVVLEADPHYVGGISRTAMHNGYRFDIGGHRFFSKNAEVNAVWSDLLGDQFLTRPRLSRIFYDGRFFHYPLKPMNALVGLGLLRSLQVLLSYAWSRIRPIRPERSFEDWVVNRFGRRLFEIFFKTYTEKVWGMSTREISADWAAQRIKGLSLIKAVTNALWGGRGSRRGEVVKTLIDQFQYPRLGPGQMWEAARDRITTCGGDVHMGFRVVSIEHEEGRVLSMVAEDARGHQFRYRGDQFLSTLPVRELIRAMDPPAPEPVRQAAEALRYRDFLTVVLIVEQPELFPDTWLYIHEPSVKLGRVQNFKNWSPEMVPDPSTTSLGLEYFCFEGDGLWSMPDDELIALGRREIDQISLATADKVIDGCVVRMPKAYPIYDDHYQRHLETIRNWLAGLDNLQLSGRNGMHKYNNQDHSMLTALLAARNMMGQGSYDPWKVNTDAEYHEEDRLGTDEQASSGRAVPQALQAQSASS